ncbi:unnamed protein product [marine sediment metagenome]|uniref:Uncharacterized protein n=1 Tax=marine sediment metagenome TaxID=412755 RepID=X1EEY2_9ZZZZ
MSKGQMTNKEYLICIDTKLSSLKEQFSNHIKHHWMVTIPMIGITGAAITALVIALLR